MTPNEQRAAETDARVYAHLLERAKEGLQCLTTKAMAELLGVDHDTITRSLRRLERARRIRREGNQRDRVFHIGEIQTAPSPRSNVQEVVAEGLLTLAREESPYTGRKAFARRFGVKMVDDITSAFELLVDEGRLEREQRPEDEAGRFVIDGEATPWAPRAEGVRHREEGAIGAIDESPMARLPANSFQDARVKKSPRVNIHYRHSEPASWSSLG